MQSKKGEKMSEDCTCDKEFVSMDEVRNEIASTFKKVFKAEYCPNCQDLQSMIIVYHVSDVKFGMMPKITENYRCPGCLKLFESKIEEVLEKHNTIDKKGMGFSHAENLLQKKIEEKKETKPLKKEEPTENA